MSSRTAASATDPAATTAGEGPETAQRISPAGNRPDDLVACLQYILHQKDVPCFSHNISKVIGLVGNDESSTCAITNTILQDCSLTLAVLRRANSARYNRSNSPIRSVARAVTLIGVEALRGLVGTMLLLEKYHKRTGHVQRLLLLSLLTANHARQIAARVAAARSEEAYLAGMFANLGEILLAHHLPARYAEIRQRMHEEGLSLRSACLRVLGFACEDLGQAMAENWGLPPSVSSAMASRPGGSPPDIGPLDAVVAFSRDLTEALYGADHDDTRAAVDLVIEKHAPSLGLKHLQVEEVVSGALSETKWTFGAAGIPVSHLRLCRAGRPGPHPQAARPDPPEGPDDCPDCDGDEIRNQLVEEVRQAAGSGAQTGLNEIVMMVLEAGHRWARFDRVVFGLATPDHSMIRGRLGLGQNVDELTSLFRVAMSDPADPFSQVLAEGRDLFVVNDRPNRYQQSRPLQMLDVACFALFPVVVEGLAVGCLYLDRLSAGEILSDQALQTIGRLRDVIADTIARLRSRSGATA